MPSDNNNTERERKVLELYDEGKTTREIAKEQRLSLRDISHILKKHEVNHGITSIDDNDNSKKSLVQALRENPDRYAIIFDNTKYDNTNNNEYLEALREVADSFLKVLSRQIVDNTMVAVQEMK